jgi:putative transposase
MCEVLKVSRSSYYSSVDRPASPRAVRQAKIHQTVAQLHDDSHGIYGSVKIARQMQQDDQLEAACRNTVARATRDLG